MKKIVLVDDNHFQLKLMRSYLKGVNAEIVAFSSSVKAWEYLQTEKVDLLITDVMMPILDGRELCEKVSRMVDGPPILAVSACQRGAGVFEKMDFGRDVSRSGADEVLFKPFYEDDFIEKVRHFLTLEAA